MIARLVTNLWYEPYAVYRYGLKKNPILYLRRYLFFAAILVITGGICYFFCNMCNYSAAVNSIIKIVICSVVTNVVFYLCFRKTDEFAYLYGSLKRILEKAIHRNK